MKLAFLYAGQGSQHAGMGADLYEKYEAFRTAFDAAKLSFDLKKVCFEDPEAYLSQTEYTQPCMVAFAAGVTAVLYEHGLFPDYAAGLSLGEYSALHAAGVFNAKTAVELAAARGKAMADASQGVESSMIAVRDFPQDQLQKCCDQVQSGHGHVQICNYNCPGQLVISGEAQAVQEAARLAKEAGAKRCIPLKVSGPFHTALMKPAGEALQVILQEVELAPMAFPVLFNCLGKEKKEEQDIAQLLVKQVQSSVYMEQIIRRLDELGVDGIIEIGPGKVLSGFVHKTLGSKIPCYPVETVEDVASLLEQFGCMRGEQ